MSAETNSAQRRKWSRYWVADPLDGTKELFKKNGEFTFNIALIEHGEPALVVVHAPALGLTYWGPRGEAAFKAIATQAAKAIGVAALPTGERAWRVAGSRSHASTEFETFVTGLPEVLLVNIRHLTKTLLGCRRHH